MPTEGRPPVAGSGRGGGTEGDDLNDPAQTTGDKLALLLDYVEQVVRLDERVAFRLSDYRLADGTALALSDRELRDCPGVALDTSDQDGTVWLALERLARREPPAPPAELAAWLALPADPAKAPAMLPERLETVTGPDRNAILAAEQAREEDFAPAPRPGEDGTPRFDRRLRVDDAPGLRAALEAWIAGPWAAWAAEEAPRRRTIGLYGRLYRLQQWLEQGGAEGGVEAVWGLGPVVWTAAGRTIERPLIEIGVELDLEPDGTLLVRPTEAGPRVDLKPYEAFGCENLALLDDVIRREIAHAVADEGVSPFRPASFEPILRAAATRLHPHGQFRRGADPDRAAPPDAPVITDGWVMFARPRSQHVQLADIARFRERAHGGAAIAGLAARLVTPPADAAGGTWTPLGDRLGAEIPGGDTAPEPALGDVFFPKPFNDDQVAIVRQLAAADGLVVQGPPGTGKTHTIANLVCHGLALGQRVLVVSRGEAALAVLREQLPDKVRPLTIAILSSERAGLRQVETAIREIQSIVEDSRPEIRTSAIRRCEAEILKIRARVAAIDRESEDIAALQAVPLGPMGESPADLARRLAAEAPAHAWFTDRPDRRADDTGLGDADLAALAETRAALRTIFDHRDAELPDPGDVPGVEEVSAWHEELSDADPARELAANGPLPGLAVSAEGAARAGLLARTLRDLAAAWDGLGEPDLVPLIRDAVEGEPAPWAGLLEELCRAWWDHETERVALATFAIEAHAALLDDPLARAAVARAAAGERMWPLISLRGSASKDLVAAVRVRGAAPGPENLEAWRAVARHLALRDQRRVIAARWRAFGEETGLVPTGAEDGREAGTTTLAWAARILAGASQARAGLADLGRGGASVDALMHDPGLLRAVAAQLTAAAATARLDALHAARHRALALFGGDDRTSAMARQFLRDVVGKHDVGPEQVRALWGAILARVEAVRAGSPAFAALRAACARVSDQGAPDWARRLGTEPPDPESDALLPPDWRRAWDVGAGLASLAAIDHRGRLLGLAREREAAERRGRLLFIELVRERAFLALERRLSPRVKSALVEYVRALGRLGKGTGKGAGRHRRTARDAMARCYDAVPCWIMPTWRVAEQLPSDLASFDLVILDEASQSDVTELPALLRGRKILAVGDDRQVSPTPPFVSQGKIDQLRHHYLRHLPYGALFEPGESLYDLMRAVFPDSRLMLKEHFRCVEPIIRFSMRFYSETLLPLRVPAAGERLDPPLVDIFVPHGRRDGARKINHAEAEVIVDEIAAIAADPALRTRTVGVISLIGAEQAELVRTLLAERIGEEAMQRHALLCGDSAAFQGNERDIVFLSMVADRTRRTSLTMLRYEQRFNVAASRARDRLVLVRSVGKEDLQAHDLKHALISHFAEPMPARASSDGLSRCESGFERDVMGRLLALGYRVEPQVGAQGFRIDLVVEGPDGRRLAVECDGDGFHGPAQWRDDMARQRILERVGWRFWRCFASSFYRDPDGTLADLVETLRSQGIEPMGAEAAAMSGRAYTEHRVVPPPAELADQENAKAIPAGPGRLQPIAPRPAGMDPAAVPAPPGPLPARIGAGDRVVLLFPDLKRLTLRLTPDADDDLPRGLLSVASPLGRALAGAEEGDEVEVPAAPGATATRVLVEAVEHAA